jgi:hypothetical protein
MNFHGFAGFLLQILLQAATTWIYPARCVVGYFAPCHCFETSVDETAVANGGKRIEWRG